MIDWHEHKCVHCGVWILCEAAVCEEQQDGEATCSACAVARFDAIVPQERV